MKTLFFGSILHDLEEVRSRHRLTIDKAADIFLNTVVAQTSVMADKATGIAFIQEFLRHLIASPLIWNALTSKHPAYEHEQEVRLVMVGIQDKLKPFIETRSRGSEIIPYIPHPWNVREPGAIVKILVGPAAAPETEDAARTMLAIFGVNDIVIKRSSIPYRVT